MGWIQYKQHDWGSVAKARSKTQRRILGFRQAYLPYFLLYQNVKER